MAVDACALEESLREFGRLTDRATSIGVIAEQMSHVVGAARVMLHVDGLGVLLVDDEAVARPVASAGSLAAAVETAQRDVEVGPGVDVLLTGRPVAVRDLPDESAYSTLWDAVEATGLRAVLSVPIQVRGEVAGNLNALDAQPHAWTDTEISAASAFADVVGTLLGVGSLMLDEYDQYDQYDQDGGRVPRQDPCGTRGDEAAPGA